MDNRPQFNSKFIVGVAQIDREHLQLFELAARVYDGLGASGEEAKAASRAAVAELLDYTTTHFTSEEKLMERAGYPELDEHRRQHGHLLTLARDLEVLAEFGDQSLPVELSHFITRWLIDHIEANDKRFGEFVAAGRNSGQAAAK